MSIRAIDSLGRAAGPLPRSQRSALNNTDSRWGCECKLPFKATETWIFTGPHVFHVPVCSPGKVGCQRVCATVAGGLPSPGRVRSCRPAPAPSASLPPEPRPLPAKDRHARPRTWRGRVNARPTTRLPPASRVQETRPGPQQTRAGCWSGDQRGGCGPLPPGRPSPPPPPLARPLCQPPFGPASSC